MMYYNFLNVTLVTGFVVQGQKHFLFFIFDEPHFIPAIGQFEGTVVPRPVIWGLLEFHSIFLEALDQFLKLIVAVLTVGKASISPAKAEREKS